jgi:hypothetical protein
MLDRAVVANVRKEIRKELPKKRTGVSETIGTLLVRSLSLIHPIPPLVIQQLVSRDA